MTARLLEAAGSFLSTSEEVVRNCMNPVFQPEMNRESCESLGRVLLETGSIFSVDTRDFSGEWVDWDAEDPPELPPLPHARIIIEGRDERGPSPISGLSLDDTDDVYPAFAVLINEHQRGVCWTVGVIYGDQEQRTRTDWVRFAYGEDGDLFPEILSEGDDDDEPHDVGPALDSLPVILYLLALLTAKNSVKREMRLSRHDSRRLGRPGHAGGVYFVDLSSSGEVRATGMGKGPRVRFLVRGHWMRNAYGDTFIPGKGLCVWRRGYIKGPPGAPWRGRPVHRVGS